MNSVNTSQSFTLSDRRKIDVYTQWTLNFDGTVTGMRKKDTFDDLYDLMDYLDYEVEHIAECGIARVVSYGSGGVVHELPSLMHGYYKMTCKYFGSVQSWLECVGSKYATPTILNALGWEPVQTMEVRGQTVVSYGHNGVVHTIARSTDGDTESEYRYFRSADKWLDFMRYKELKNVMYAYTNGSVAQATVFAIGSPYSIGEYSLRVCYNGRIYNTIREFLNFAHSLEAPVPRRRRPGF
jgi:hypothetical protein